jgi:hypothetical protein
MKNLPQTSAAHARTFPPTGTVMRTVGFAIMAGAFVAAEVLVEGEGLLERAVSVPWR